MSMESIRKDVRNLVNELSVSGHLKAGEQFVIGCSTSEIAGERIGTSGSEEIAAVLFEEMQSLRENEKIELVFQCCEHLNRALVMERKTMEKRGYEQVSAIPVPKAGGAMAAYAFNHMEDPVVVEEIKAESGIDIGDTMIGMHLKRVAVPLRFKQKSIGKAHLTAARTRPRLIGGERAVYKKPQVEADCD
ncbi:TIGR01440 family protein [Thalassobacillus devorans]|uniref:TIGR01440 family protein n=1 Tax=Thalassobacillus devorans TaxID=279813 RepID=UPI0004B63CB6|nr:TIGR01440 family protein [Thalassobacillus devorans]